MPSKSGASEEIISENIKTEVEHGRPHAQDVAIALNKADESGESKDKERSRDNLVEDIYKKHGVSKD